jgi:hypothetical protein
MNIKTNGQHVRIIVDVLVETLAAKRTKTLIGAAH